MKLSITWWLIILCSALLIFFVGGCVNVNNPDASTVDYHSLVKFIDLSTVGSGISVKVDNNNVISSLAPATNSTYLDLESGTRFFSITYAGTSPAIQDTFRNALTPNYKYTYFCVCDPTGGDQTRNYLLYPERQTYSGAVVTIANNVLVRFINLSEDTSASVAGGVQFHLIYNPNDTTTVDTTTASALVFKGISPYYQAALSVNAQFFVMNSAGDDTILTSAAVPSTQGRFSIVLYGFRDAGTLKTIVFKED